MRNVSCAFINQLFYCSQVKNSPLLCAQIKTGGWKSSECLCCWFEQRWNVPADTQTRVWERCYSRNLGPDTVSGSVRLGATRIIRENFKPGSPWQQRIPRSRRPLTDISAASPGRPRCMAHLSAGGFWQTRTGSEVRDQMITGIHQHSFILLSVKSVLPLLGEVLQVLLHSAVQRVKSFNVQRVQHLSLENPEQNGVAW